MEVGFLFLLGQSLDEEEERGSVEKPRKRSGPNNIPGAWLFGSRIRLETYGLSGIAAASRRIYDAGQAGKELHKLT
jgi:hypothetical protein